MPAMPASALVAGSMRPARRHSGSSDGALIVARAVPVPGCHRPSIQRDRTTADTERGGHRGRGSRRLTAGGTRADPGGQPAIVVAADTGTSRPEPGPDGNTRHPNVPPTQPPAGRHCSSGTPHSTA
jgi:hypothetical protein